MSDYDSNGKALVRSKLPDGSYYYDDRTRQVINRKTTAQEYWAYLEDGFIRGPGGPFGICQIIGGGVYPFCDDEPLIRLKKAGHLAPHARPSNAPSLHQYDNPQWSPLSSEIDLED